MAKRVVTQDDLDNNQDLEAQGAVLGEEFDFPEEEQSGEGNDTEQ